MSLKSLWRAALIRAKTVIDSSRGQSIIAFLRARLNEKTTWIGIGAIFGGLGIHIVPASANNVESFSIAAIGVFLFFVKERG